MIATDTQRLAAARFEVVSDARARGATRSALVAIMVLLALAAGLRLVVDGKAMADERSRLRQENSGLRAEVASLEAELDLERATHAALHEQVATLNRQVAELERQLAFVNAQRARPRAAAQPD